MPSLRMSGQLSPSIVNSGGSFENDRMSNFEGLQTSTLDRVILHTVVNHSSTCSYMSNFSETGETFVDGRTYTRMDGHLRPAL